MIDQYSLLDFSSAGVFNIWSVLTGFVLLNIAAFGVDQDVTQRILTWKDAKSASKALISSIAMGIPVVLIFISNLTLRLRGNCSSLRQCQRLFAGQERQIKHIALQRNVNY